MNPVQAGERALDYEEAWAQWGDLPRYSPSAIHLRRLILAEARQLKFESVLDVGCGLGMMLQSLRAEFPSVRCAGADVASNVIERARALLPDVQFNVADCAAAPPPGRHDLILLSEVIEHLEDPWTTTRNLRAACSGHLIVTTPTGPRLGTDHAFGHLRHFTPEELRTLVEEAGFEVIRLYRWGWPFQVMFRKLLNLSAERAHSTFAGGGGHSLLKRVGGTIWSALFHLNIRGRGTQLVLVGRAK
jgi:SAM-dependent methyltransferase